MVAAPPKRRSFVILKNTALFILIGVFAVGWTSGPPAGLVHPVNMTLAGDRLFVSDRYNGIHVFDVFDPSAPEPALAIPLQGNRGTAVRGDIVYANDYYKLLVIRVEGDSYEVLEEIQLHDPYLVDPAPLNDGVVTRSNRFGCESCQANRYAPEPSALSAPSQGSSFATFAVIDDYLYYLDYGSIVTLDITVPEKPTELSRTAISRRAETLFPGGNKLFVGGRQGMYVFDLSKPEAPREIGRIEHVVACDPVVVSGSVAYVTLRGGNACGQNNNLLLCVDISDPAKPVVIGEKEVTTPYGLAVRDPFLYVSNGKSGYKLFDIARPWAPEGLAAWGDWATKDFIWSNSILYVLGFDDLRIFDVSDPKAPRLLAAIDHGTS